MTISIVSTTAQLIAAIHGAQGGDIIKLAPGTYSSVNISNANFSLSNKVGGSGVCIESEYASRPAVLTDLTVRSSHGLSFVDLKMSAASNPAGEFVAANITPFNVDSSQNVSFQGITVSGNPAGTLNNTVSGMLIRDSSYVSVSNSSFSYLHNAINQLDDNHLSITGNTFGHIWDDGVRGGGSSNVTISGNNFTDFHPDPTDTDHPDLIQFWTSNQTASVSNITVDNNTFIRGTGGAVQGLFIRDEVGDLPYYNVTAEYNDFIGTSYNGINFRDVIGGILAHNTVTSYLDYNSSIDVYDGSRNVTVEYNSAESYMYTGSTDLTLIDNIITRAVAAPRAAMAFRALGGYDVSSDVPEPGSWALATAGLGLMGAFLRGRKTKPALRT